MALLTLRKPMVFPLTLSGAPADERIQSEPGNLTHSEESQVSGIAFAWPLSAIQARFPVSATTKRWALEGPARPRSLYPW